MPFVKGLREYYYYNDEESDYDDCSFEEKQAKRLSKVAPYNPVETLHCVAKALQGLPKEVAVASNETSSSSVEENGQGDSDDKEPQQFYAEDLFSFTDIQVTVNEVGELSFPLEEESIQKLVTIPSKETVGSGSKELLDVQVQDTHMIPSSEVRVEFKAETLSNIIKKVSNSLNMNENCILKLHLYNMLIYTRTQGIFYNLHKDTEIIDNMVATMVVVLPSAHKGGDLYVKHGTQNHSFSSSENLGQIKTITFYSDCEHKVSSVESGHRVVLTYNVELQYPPIAETVVLPEVDLNLSSAIAEHFAHENNPKRLTVFLLHSYSEKSLKWHMIKGRDRTYARALLSVAKDQDLTPCLALASCFEAWEASGYHGPVRNDAFVKLHYWVDDRGMKLDKFLILDYEDMAKEVCTFRKEFWSLGEPDKEETLGWYGNSPAIREQCYNKACIVLSKKLLQ